MKLKQVISSNYFFYTIAFIPPVILIWGIYDAVKSTDYNLIVLILAIVVTVMAITPFVLAVLKK